MNNKQHKGIIEEVSGTIGAAEKTVHDVMHGAGTYIKPVRQSVFNRFPTLFLVLVTFGVAATFFGVERLIAQWTWLYDRPIIILVAGLAVLAGTGTLYKKLG